MADTHLPRDALRAADAIKRADIVIGIPSYNNSRTIGQVVRAACAGLAKYFPQLTGVIVNSDGGSTDGTPQSVLQACLEDSNLLMLATPMSGSQRLSFPYPGVLGKGSAFRMVFQMAERLQARACAVIDSDLRSITPEWFDLLLRPILFAGFDFVAPYYHRHKYDGTITNSIVYPMTRSLYGARVRQPIGGEFGISARLFSRYLERDDWETDVARYGIDIWMTTIALAEGFRVCQSFLGAKLHAAKEPGADLSDMLQQVVGSVFALMQEYEPVWRNRAGSEPVDLFGFPFAVGLDPIRVNTDRMLQAFCHGCQDLEEVWSAALQPDTYQAVRQLAGEAAREPAAFRMQDEVWTRVVLDFACAYKKLTVTLSHLLKSLTPLYLARVASFVQETQSLVSAQVEQKIEELCLCFETHKAYLVSQWDSQPVPAAGRNKRKPALESGELDRAKLEVQP